MAGVKGRSGRKSNYSEIQDGNLEKVCVDWILNNFNTFDRATKLKVSLTIASKAVTQKIDFKDKTKLSSDEKSEVDEMRKIRNDSVNPELLTN